MTTRINHGITLTLQLQLQTLADKIAITNLKDSVMSYLNKLKPMFLRVYLYFFQASCTPK